MSTHSRDSDKPVRWVPISQLPPLATALLAENLGDRDVVPGHVADRVTKLAAEWEANGFTRDTVRPWVDLAPPIAGYLASRGVAPAALDTTITLSPGTEPTTLHRALAAGLLTAEEAYRRLSQAGAITPPRPQSTTPTETQAPASPFSAGLFSHPVADLPQSEQETRPRPSWTPFTP